MPPATHDRPITIAMSEPPSRVSSIAASSGAKSAGSTPASPPRQQQSEHRAAERDRQAFDHDLTDQVWRLAPSASLTASSRRLAALLDSSRLPALTQALSNSRPVEPSTTTLISRTCALAAASSREYGVAVNRRGSSSSLRVPLLVSGNSRRQARSRGVELTRGVGEIRAVPETADNRQPAIAARSSPQTPAPGESTHRTSAPAAGRRSAMARPTQSRDRRRRSVNGRPIGSAGAPSAFHNPSLMTAGGTGPAAGRLTAPPMPIAGKNSGDTDTTRTRCDRSPRRTTVTCESSKAASDWNAGAACFIERKSG